MVFSGLGLVGAAAGIKEIRDRDTLQETERSCFFFLFFFTPTCPLCECVSVCVFSPEVRGILSTPPPRTLLPTHRRPKLSQCRSSPSRCRVPLIINSRCVGEASHTRSPHRTGGTEAERQKYLFDRGRCCRCHRFIAVFLA